MKKEISPAAIVAVILVVLVAVFGVYYWLQRPAGNPESGRIVGPDGKKHFPHMGGVAGPNSAHTGGAAGSSATGVQ